MSPPKSSYQLIAQAETLLIYGIFLFLTGLAQIAVTIGYRYIADKSDPNIERIHLTTFLPQSFSINEIHLWYIYPSAGLVSENRMTILFNSLIRFERKNIDFNYPSQIIFEHATRFTSS